MPEPTYIRSSPRPHGELSDRYVEMQRMNGDPRAGEERITATTRRQRESTMRLSETHARMRFSEFVESEDVREANRLMRDVIRTSSREDMRKEVMNIFNADGNRGVRWAEVLKTLGSQSAMKVDAAEFGEVTKGLENEGLVELLSLSCVLLDIELRTAKLPVVCTKPPRPHPFRIAPTSPICHWALAQSVIPTLTSCVNLCTTLSTTNHRDNLKEDSKDIESAKVAVSVEGQPDNKTRRYDRQLRLWAASSQSELENSRILVIFGSATSTSILKNLALPGIGHFTILDHTKVTPEDAGNNFSSKGLRALANRTQTLHVYSFRPLELPPVSTAAGELCKEVDKRPLHILADKRIDLNPCSPSFSKPDVAPQLRENKQNTSLRRWETDGPGGENSGGGTVEGTVLRAQIHPGHVIFLCEYGTSCNSSVGEPIRQALRSTRCGLESSHR
ncbi:MCM DNA helicase complex subunit [Marasmius sp. AFHP31]|nr:MCM DNA helicase complex subunit [Marasmius sp. AFHP31]